MATPRLSVPRLIALLLSVASLESQAQTSPTQAAHELGGAFVQSYPQMLSTTPAHSVPGYSATPPTQTNLFQRGQGNTVSAGATAVSHCQSATDPGCQAVNLLSGAGQNQGSSQFKVPASDPIVQSARTIAADPSALVGTLASTYEGCSTSTINTSATYTTKVCDLYASVSALSCTENQQVAVNADYLYACTNAVQTQSSNSCTINEIVQVNPTSVYQCLEQLQTQSTNTCAVNDVVVVAADYTYACTNTIKVQNTSTCNSVENVQVAAAYTYTCQQSAESYQNLNCSRTLNTTCAFGAAAIRGISTASGGTMGWPTLSMTPAGPAGVYNYTLYGGACEGNGWAEIDFNLDSVGQGSYITINVGSLDDAAAVAVNGYTVFAGYPNSGPAYSGAGVFPQAYPAFQLGYTWNETYVAGSTCSEWGEDGGCIGTSTPIYRNGTFTANTKLSDMCPAGYSPTSMASFVSCDESGNCWYPDTDTTFDFSGFFCNAEGKFLMNRHEGRGTWGGAVNAEMPIQFGANKIQVYWGTGHSGCGQVSVTGQVYNVAPQCTGAQWNDGCAGLEARTH